MVRVYFEIDMAKFKLIVHVVMLVYSQNEEFLNGRRNKLLKFIMDSVLVRRVVCYREDPANLDTN